MKTFLSENSVFLKTVAVGLAILVLVFSLPISSSAAYENLSDCIVPIGNSTPTESEALYLGYSTVQTNTSWYAVCDAPNVLACRFGNSEQAHLLYKRQDLNPTIYFSNGLTGSFDRWYNNVADGQYVYHIIMYGEGASNLISFESMDEAFAALEDYIANPPPPPPPPESVSTLNYSLPPGNVAFVKLPDDVSLFEGVTLRTQMPESNLLYAPNGQLWNSSQRTGFTGSLPTADFDLSQFSLISWAKDGETTVLGQTKNAIYSRGPLLIGNEYMVIVNPIYYGGTANGPYEFMLNGAVQINAVGVKGISVYALDSSIGFTSQGGLTVPTEVIGDPFGGEIDAETGEITWTDPSGGTNAPTEGGNNLIPTGETVFDAVKKIASDFADFLKGPISAIRTVVSAITNFLIEFKSLYVWLPGPVYNLITSAIMVALTIGVVKIFV